MRKLIIDRKLWERGRSFIATIKDPEGKNVGILPRLLGDNAMMCCLGFDLLGCGLAETQIIGISKPAQIQETIDKYPLAEHYKDKDWVRKALSVNDANMNQDLREQLLIEHFAKKNIELSFIN